MKSTGAIIGTMLLASAVISWAGSCVQLQQSILNPGGPSNTVVESVNPGGWGCNGDCFSSDNADAPLVEDTKTCTSASCTNGYCTNNSSSWICAGGMSPWHTTTDYHASTINTPCYYHSGFLCNTWSMITVLENDCNQTLPGASGSCYATWYNGTCGG